MALARASRPESPKDGAREAKSGTLRSAPAPAMLILLTLTVQVCVGGPVWAATVLRHEVAAQRDQARHPGGAVRAFAGIVATSPAREFVLDHEPERPVRPVGRTPAFEERVGCLLDAALPPPAR